MPIAFGLLLLLLPLLLLFLFCTNRDRTDIIKTAIPPVTLWNKYSFLRKDVTLLLSTIVPNVQYNTKILTTNSITS